MEANEGRIAEQVRRGLDQGVLPREHPRKIWMGYGDWHLCTVCGLQLLPAHVMRAFELNEQTYRFHIGCYGLWTGELIRRGLYTPE